MVGEETNPRAILNKLYKVTRELVEQSRVAVSYEAIGRTYGYAEALRFLGYIKDEEFHKVANKLLLLRGKIVKKEEKC